MQNENGQQDDVTVLPELLKTAETAALANVGQRTWWRWSRSGIAPRPIKIGPTTVRFRRDIVLAWIRAGCPRYDQWEGADDA